MAKRSNKTAHVLNLISGGDNDTKQKQDAEDEGSVSVVSQSTESSDLADNIKTSLEAELEAAIAPEIDDDDDDDDEDEPVVVAPKQAVDKPITKNEKFDDTYEYICVMEKIVEQNILPYMDRFGNCKCSRCVADTTALALTNLPAKYVVAHVDDVSPLIDFYWKKYESQILSEIIKSCIRVASKPHHQD